MSKRLFIVSNRLPLVVQQDNDKTICKQSSGGLVSAISTYLNSTTDKSFSGVLWAGVPGCTENTWAEAAQSMGPREYTYLPVFPDKEKYDLYYSGVSNSMIWPLFHYFPSFAEYNPSHFDTYLEVNRVFADTLIGHLKKGDIVWIHDYHLLPLAAILREKQPDITIGFFLHIPFPSFEIFRVIPKAWQKELLQGILGADLIGFHTIDYCKHFLACVEAIFNANIEGQFIHWNNRQIKADAFPISIDFELFNSAFDDPEVVQIRKKYENLKGDKKLIFSVDRLDYTKGISNRLRGFEDFLVNCPEYYEKVIFALNIIPSRDSITKYAERKTIIDQYISNLNSSLGSLSWQPVSYQYNHLSFKELIALYTACDLALITPLRDGMNLISKEFIASRKDKKGVLILSEMAGASNELTEALLINPNDKREIAQMLKEGLEMSAAEQEQRISIMQERLKDYDVRTWAADFIGQMEAVKNLQLEYEIKFVDNLAKADILSNFSEARQSIFLLDYDGSLVPFTQNFEQAVPSVELLHLLTSVSAIKGNDVYIISGRSSALLEQWFEGLPIGLIAEHGAKIRPIGDTWKVAEDLQSVPEWMTAVERLMSSFLTKCAYSFIEKKEYSIVWHYRKSDSSTGQLRAKELTDALQRIAIQFPITILNGHKIVEVKPKGIDKGFATEYILGDRNYDFIFAVGDDVTDEDMFRKLARKSQAFTIKVGAEASFAKYNLHSPNMVQSLLHLLANYPKRHVIKEAVVQM